jgi:hypothetical protein
MMLKRALFAVLRCNQLDRKVRKASQSARKFTTRCATLRFMHAANLDEGAMWPSAFALMESTADQEARIVALMKKAVT